MKPSTEQCAEHSPETYICPWCDAEVTPLLTAEHKNKAVFRYTYPDTDPQAYIRNPAMCPNCFGVGGWQDFQVE